MTTQPNRFNIKVIASAAKSDHQAIVATAEMTIRDRSQTATKRMFRRRNPDAHARMLRDLREYDDLWALETEDLVEAWREFYQTMGEWMNEYYPLLEVTTTSRDPPFMTGVYKYFSGFSGISGAR